MELGKLELTKWKIFIPNEPEQKWSEMRSQCVTNFIMPHHAANFQPLAVSENCFENFPFERFCVTETFTLDQNLIQPDNKLYLKNSNHDVVHGIEEMIVWKESEDTVGLISKIRYFNGPVANGVLYTPNQQILSSKDEILNGFELYFRFYNYLNDRKIRYVEQSTSRQVRRSLGVSSDYKEYVMIKREDVKYANSIPRSEMMKRMQSLHRVRGHLRLNFRTGEKSIRVRDYVKGQGNILVDKDYRFK